MKPAIIAVLFVAGALAVIAAVIHQFQMRRALRELGIRYSSAWAGTPGYLERRYENAPPEQRTAELDRLSSRSRTVTAIAVVLVLAAAVLGQCAGP